MADIICPKCKRPFDNNNSKSLVTRGSAAVAGGVPGAYFGEQVGIVLGPLGAMNGLWIGAVAGGLTGWFAADQFRRCPKCRKVFKT